MPYRGFTFIELIIVLCITSMTLFFAMPYFANLFKQQESELIRQELLQALQLASLQTSIYKTTITICPSDDKQSCRGQWQDGFIVFFGKEQITINKENILLATHWKNSQGTLKWHGFHRLATGITFHYQGVVNSDNGQFVFIDNQKRLQWTITLNRFGRCRTSL